MITYHVPKKVKFVGGKIDLKDKRLKKVVPDIEKLIVAQTRGMTGEVHDKIAALPAGRKTGGFNPARKRSSSMREGLTF